MLKCAVIGSGATGFAVVDALCNVPDVEITVIHPARKLSDVSRCLYGRGADGSRTTSDILRASWKRSGFVFPPPKTQFGVTPDKLSVNGWGTIWESNLRGGLTQFWGGSSPCFSNEEFKSWPIDRSELEPHYQALADSIGFTGGDDGLRRYLDDQFAKLPAIEPVQPIKALLEGLQTGDGCDGFEVFAGYARLAVETRPDSANGCTFTGECMSGCHREAVFSAKTAFDRLFQKGAIADEVHGIVHAIDRNRGVVILRVHQGIKELFGFDRIFICAGCIQSNEILLRSLDVGASAVISDNTIYSVPIIFTGKTIRQEQNTGYFALTNGQILVRVCDDFAPVFVQLYPTPDYFWEYYLPYKVSRWVKRAELGHYLRTRLFWGRVYVHSDHSQSYRLRIKEDSTLDLTLETPPDKKRFLERVWPKLRQLICTGPFWIPPLSPTVSRTSAHYSGGFPMGSDIVGIDGHLGAGFYLCDSANFPDCPSLSHTFTSMANARRIALQAVA